MKKRTAFLAFLLHFCLLLSAQDEDGTEPGTDFSFGTGLVGLRNFSPQQGFWAVGQSVRGILHFSPRHAAYASLDYYLQSNYTNRFTAEAKSASTSPRQLPFTATGRLGIRQLSLGYQRYVAGNHLAENGFSFYGKLGFGLLFGPVSNKFSVAIDTARYRTPVLAGEGSLRRLTFDVGAGIEHSLGGGVHAFADLRTWLPASLTESPFLHNQKNVPLSLAVAAGLRIFFGTRY